MMIEVNELHPSKVFPLTSVIFDGNFILNSDDVLKLNYLPKSVLIVGSGAIGIEWTRIFSNFGVEVHIVELAEHLIPLADIEVSKRIERIFKKEGVKYEHSTYGTRLKKGTYDTVLYRLLRCSVAS